VSKMPITDFNQELLDKGILVDVRTPEEFGAGHLENAENVNWYEPNFMEHFSAVDKRQNNICVLQDGRPKP